eukprot:1828248-Pyramimonas_sp.AAC.1
MRGPQGLRRRDPQGDEAQDSTTAAFHLGASSLVDGHDAHSTDHSRLDYFAPGSGAGRGVPRCECTCR